MYPFLGVVQMKLDAPENKLDGVVISPKLKIWKEETMAAVPVVKEMNNCGVPLMPSCFN